MGEVVEAWDVVLCRTVALKILRNMEPTSLIRFMHEAQIQARVAHPHICRIYDVDSSEGTVKIAMQLIRGPNLEQACRELSVEAVVTLVAEVAEAVHAAHNLKLIHRDLKPSNILLERGVNGKWIPYIADFGLAMAMDEPALTFTHGVIGTPAYMAPEQFHGERSRIGPPTDVYALGGTLHFALLGKVPPGAGQGAGLSFTAPDPGAVTPRFTRPDAIPAELWIIIRQCLEVDPALRYPSAAALAEDLWRFLHGEPVEANPPGAVMRLWRQHRRLLKLALPAVLVAGGMAAGALATGSYLGVVHGRRMEQTRQFSLEAMDLERVWQRERALPPHDLRPASLRLGARMRRLEARLDTLDGAIHGPAHLALARVHLLLEECDQAQREAQSAWDHGFHDPDVAYVLACAIGRSTYQISRAGAMPVPIGGDTAARLEALFALSRGSKTEEEDYARALVAFVRKDYGTAAAAARTASRLRPWDADAVCLEALSRCAIASQRLEAADLAGAEEQGREALAVAEAALPTAPSDEDLCHAVFFAARMLATVEAEQGDLPADFLPAYEKRCDQAILLNPGNPELQDDWLGLHILNAKAMSELQQNPEAALNAALVFIGTHLNDPIPQTLKYDRMLIYWCLAELAMDQGRDPGPSLQEAVKDLELTPFLQRDAQTQVLNTKARAEAARGVDPRPTVTGALARLDPLMASHPSWALDEAAGEAWLIKGEWEAAHGLEASASLAEAGKLSQRALQANPNSATAQALNGLCQVLAIQIAPERKAILRLVAQERLRKALSLKAPGRLQRRLRKFLAVT
jgi:serine/threonine-protein kinase